MLVIRSRRINFDRSSQQWMPLETLQSLGDPPATQHQRQELVREWQCVFISPLNAFRKVAGTSEEYQFGCMGGGSKSIPSSVLIAANILADVSAPRNSAKWASISAVSSPSSVNPMI